MPFQKPSRSHRTVKDIVIVILFVACMVGLWYWTSGFQSGINETFSNDLDKKWTKISGSWQVQDGTLHGGPSSGHHYLLYDTGDNSLSDFVLTVDVRVKEGSYHHPAVAFRTASETEHYLLRVNEWGSKPWDGFQLFIRSTSDSRYEAIDTDWQQIGGAPFNTFTDTDAMKEETWYTMKIEADGATIRAKMWERDLAEPTDWPIVVEDATYPSGKIGLEYYNGAHEFDNLRVIEK